MTRRTVIRMTLLAAASSCLFYLVGQQQLDSHNKALPHDRLERSAMEMAGLHYRVVRDGSALYEVRADFLKIAPARFLAFKVRSVNEALLNNADIILYFDQPSGSREGADFRHDPLSSLFTGLASSGRQAGLISGAMVNGLGIRIFHSGVLVQQVKASGAQWKMDGSTRFFEAELEDSIKRKVVRAARIDWDPDHRKFVAL